MLEATRYKVVTEAIERAQLAARRAQSPEERIAHCELELLLIEARHSWCKAKRAARPGKRRKALSSIEAAE